MKKILLALTLVFAVSSSAFAASTESEPNDTFETADFLTINSTISGQTNGSDEDFFVFVANKTGKVRTSLIDNNSKGVSIYGVFESDKTTMIGDSGSGVPLDINVVAGKTYYIKVMGIIGTSSYNLSVNNL
ncbi:hypothetical protein HP567_008730 [Brevibacillus sp. M2.1A]|uniref:hypothetical protein n=1 Tax=Brevibacillus TaxID=55080 RepID=UPI00156B62F0|nr:MULTISPECIES: hypothetical protein [Brevibacillus]MBY0085314.1 hypothetical protein [Brevibacillus brevis]MCC8434622.1 hypothetical protein [Brevibacillus sp. M2.1A]